ncbi:MAG: DUF255 domain-containing protein [Longimicrobiales bacterium]|nr:DUF255 domain-containing protein [Longimicrobiales bacterium]
MSYFRYSPRPNRADAIDWRPWSAAAFEAAQTAETPILLVVTTCWCQACQELDEEALSDDGVIELVNDALVPIRVDGDRLPHVQERYIAEGWPTVALLAPTGEVFWSAAGVEPRELRRVTKSVLEAWSDRRSVLEDEIEKRRKAIDAARSRRSATGLVRREAADDVLTGAQDQFDTRNGGFGQGPKFVHSEAIELLMTQGEALPNPDWVTMAVRTLDGMLAGELQDEVDGGWFHYAVNADWTDPRTEKLLPINARVLSAFAFGASRRDRDDWLEAAERTVAWVDETLGQDGLWVGSQLADPEYYGAADRSERDPPPTDDTVYTDYAAMWITALARAGLWLDRDDWVERASQALDTLLDAMAEGETLVHFRPSGDDSPDDYPPAGLLGDLLHTARAAMAVAEATDRADALEHASRLVSIMKDTLWDEAGGFQDHAPGRDPIGPLRYPDRPFEENALAARLHIRLARATGDRSYRAVAERLLAFLAPYAGRYAVEGATFAMAVEEFFERER